MPSNRATVLCRYHYDPLDRLAASTPSAQASAQRFYLKDRLTTEIQGAVQRSIMQHEDQLLAQRERQTTAVHTHLLATDQQRSVLNLLDTVARHALVYTPYGHRHWQNALLSLLGFNGERRDPLTGWYFLGNGYRAFNTVLMRFNSPDSWSPFGKGGLNAYGYCVGDPVNQVDPTGRAPLFPSFPSGYNPIKGIRNILGRSRPIRRDTPLRASTTASSSHLAHASETNAAQTTKDMTIASQQETIKSLQETIKSQQKTIASQQKNLDSAVTTIEQGKAIVSVFQETTALQKRVINQLEAKIDDLLSDLNFAVQSNPHSGRSQADIIAAYGSPSQQSRGISAASTDIRRA